MKLGKIKVVVSLVFALLAVLTSDKHWVLIVYIAAALFHELGHLTAAKVLGIRIKNIKFDISGIRICVDEKLVGYIQEFWLALAGPVANASVSLIVLTGYRFFRFFPDSIFDAAADFLSIGRFNIIGMGGFFILASLVQASINLLPIKTFDGGRMLYCILSEYTNEKTAEYILSITSAISAFVLWTIALYLMLKISAGLGIYVFAACIFFIILNKVQ